MNQSPQSLPGGGGSQRNSSSGGGSSGGSSSSSSKINPKSKDSKNERTQPQQRFKTLNNDGIHRGVVFGMPVIQGPINSTPSKVAALQSLRQKRQQLDLKKQQQQQLVMANMNQLQASLGRQQTLGMAMGMPGRNMGMGPMMGCGPMGPMHFPVPVAYAIPIPVAVPIFVPFGPGMGSPGGLGFGMAMPSPGTGMSMGKASGGRRLSSPAAGIQGRGTPGPMGLRPMQVQQQVRSPVTTKKLVGQTGMGASLKNPIVLDDDDVISKKRKKAEVPSASSEKDTCNTEETANQEESQKKKRKTPPIASTEDDIDESANKKRSKEEKTKALPRTQRQRILSVARKCGGCFLHKWKNDYGILEWDKLNFYEAHRHASSHPLTLDEANAFKKQICLKCRLKEATKQKASFKDSANDTCDSVMMQKKNKKTKQYAAAKPDKTLAEKQRRCKDCQRHPRGIGCSRHYSKLQTRNIACGKVFGFCRNKKTNKMGPCPNCISHGYYCLSHSKQAGGSFTPTPAQVKPLSTKKRAAEKHAAVIAALNPAGTTVKQQSSANNDVVSTAATTTQAPDDRPPRKPAAENKPDSTAPGRADLEFKLACRLELTQRSKQQQELSAIGASASINTKSQIVRKQHEGASEVVGRK